MTPRQKLVTIVIALAIFFAIVELVRRRKLREEYSWLWLLTGAALVVVTVWYELLVLFARLLGAVLPTSALFLLAIIFLILVAVQFSVRISKLTNQMKDLTQEIALLKAAKKDRGGETNDGRNPPP